MKIQDQLPEELRGAQFLLSEQRPESIFTPEDLTVDEKQMADTASSFMVKEVFPKLDELENQEPRIAQELFRKAGSLGFFGIEVPEQFGGFGLGKSSAIGVNEQLSRLAGFGITCGAHTGIGMQPLLYFGTDVQKTKYLSKLASGEWMAAYCLTEADSGSDALGMKARAVLSSGRTHYILSGVKMWITNAGWADLYTVFAKVDGVHVTAFLVERSFVGLSTGKEEHKLGIKASSTRRVILDDVAVPIENVLGGVGNGGYIAFNILNFGRYSLAAGLLGPAREQVRGAIRYAQQRVQFGKPISQFGLIQEKLARMTVEIFAVESATYRTAGLIDRVFESGMQCALQSIEFPRALEEFALESSIVKVRSSEMLFRVADEAIQIHGGYGYTEEFSPARVLRDSRINRIFEGTNEINRLFIPSVLLKRNQKARFPLSGSIAIANEAVSKFKFGQRQKSEIDEASLVLKNAKYLALYSLGLALSRFGDRLHEEQESVAALADIFSDIYLLDSTVLRTRKTISAKPRRGALFAEMQKLFLHEARDRILANIRKVLEVTINLEEVPFQELRAQHMLSVVVRDLKSTRRNIAEKILAEGDYPS